MATPFIRFPGGAGDKVYTNDTNLLNADVAHSVQGTTGRVPSNCTAVIDGTRALFGPTSLKVDVITPGATLFDLWSGDGVGGIPIQASTEYALGCQIWPTIQGGSVGVDAYRLQIDQYDGGGASSGAAVVVTEFGDMPAGQWNRLEGLFTSYPTTAFVRPRVRINTAPGGTEFWEDECYLRAGSDLVFLPSLDIVGTSFESEIANPTPVGFVNLPPLEVGGGYTGDVQQWALHDGSDAAAPIVAQVLALDALRALPL